MNSRSSLIFGVVMSVSILYSLLSGEYSITGKERKQFAGYPIIRWNIAKSSIFAQLFFSKICDTLKGCSHFGNNHDKNPAHLGGNKRKD